MTALILVCHAPLGQALHAVACHAFGRYIADVTVVDISANSSLDEATAAIENAWIGERRSDNVVLMADLLGATPSNAVSAWLSLHRDIQARGITGVSVPMMLRALTYRELDPDTLVSRLQECMAPSCTRIEPAG